MCASSRVAHAFGWNGIICWRYSFRQSNGKPPLPVLLHRRNVSLNFALIYDNVFFVVVGIVIVLRLVPFHFWHHHLSAPVSVPPYHQSPNAHRRICIVRVSSRCDGWTNASTAWCWLMVLFVDLLYIPFKWTSELFMKIQITSRVKYTTMKENETEKRRKNTWFCNHIILAMPFEQIAAPHATGQRAQKTDCQWRQEINHETNLEECASLMDVSVRLVSSPLHSFDYVLLLLLLFSVSFSDDFGIISEYMTFFY